MVDGQVGTESCRTPLEITGKIVACHMKLATLSGRDAVILYLVNKHHWTLEATRKLSDADLEFLTDHVRGESSSRDAIAAR